MIWILILQGSAPRGTVLIDLLNAIVRAQLNCSLCWIILSWDYSIQILITVLNHFAYWDRNRINANELIGFEHAKNLWIEPSAEKIFENIKYKSKILTVLLYLMAGLMALLQSQHLDKRVSALQRYRNTGIRVAPILSTPVEL